MIERKNFKAVIFLLVTVIAAAPAFADNCCPGCAAKTQTPKASNTQTSKLMADQYKTLMQTKIFLDSPMAIMARTKVLSLTTEQNRKLLEIERQARKKALAVLTPGQRKKLGNVSVAPISMASLCQTMCGKMTAGTTVNKQTQTAQQIACPVAGGKINKDVFTVYKGKKVYFCCAGCMGTFKASPQKYIDKLPQFKKAQPPAKAIAASAESEQKVCPIMGGGINKAVFTKYKGKKVYFCCAGCETPFLKNPEKYMSKLPQFKN
jgi:YHS domain-containing protein